MILDKNMTDTAGLLLTYVANSYGNTVEDLAELLGMSTRDTAVLVGFLIKEDRLQLIGDKVLLIKRI